MKTCATLSAVLALSVASSAASAAVYHWETAASGNWNNGAAWTPDGVPGAGTGDTAILDATGSSYTVSLNTNPAYPLAGFTLDDPDATFSAVSKTLTVDGPSTIAQGSVLLRTSTWAGSGTLRNNGSMTALGVSTISTAVFQQDGTLLIQGNPTGSHATLYATNGLSNSGTITMDSASGSYSCALDVTSGTLANLGAGVINIEPGAGGSRYLRANLTNDGTVNVNTVTQFIESNGVYTNNGQLNVAANKSVTISGSNQTFNQNGGTLNLTGALAVSNATFNYNGGTIVGTPILNDIMFSIAPAATNPAIFEIRGTSTLTSNINAGQIVALFGNSIGGHATLTSPTGFTNAGTLNLTSANGGYSSILDITIGTLTNAAGGNLTFSPGTGGTRQLRASLLNEGTVHVNTDTTFLESNGTYTNQGTLNIHAGKTLTINVKGQTFNQDAGLLDINGALSLYNLTFNYNGGTIVGTPSLNDASLSIAPTATNPASFVLSGINGLSSDIHPGQSVALIGNSSGGHAILYSLGFTNAGTLTLSSTDGGYSSEFHTETGTLTNAATGVLDILPGTGGARTLWASLINNGTVNVDANTNFTQSHGTYTNNGQLNIAAGKVLLIAGGDETLNQNAGTLDINGELLLSGLTVNYNGGAILGTPTLRSTTFNIAPTGTAPASFLLWQHNTLTSDVPTGHVLTVQGNSTGSYGLLVSPTGFHNAGTLTLESVDGGYNSTLDVLTGTLVNTPTGTINLNQGTGGSRTLDANLTNHGVVNINIDTIFDKAGGVYSNHGQFNIAAGKILTISGNSQTFNQNAGTLDIDGTMFVSDMTFHYAGGTILGTPQLDRSTLHIAPTATNPATFVVSGNKSTLTSDINAGQTVIVQGRSIGGQATLVSPTGFENAGHIVLETSDYGYSCVLAVTAGTLVNATTGTIDINQGSGGQRLILAELDNCGTVNWNTTGSLYEPGAVHVNQGVFNIAESATAEVIGATFTNAPGGTIAGNGTLDVDHVSNIVFRNAGTISPGFSPGILTIDGDYTQLSAGSLAIELGGLVAGDDYDRLVIDGGAQLDGRLDLALLGTFVPDPTDTFVILTADDISGTFSNAATIVHFNGGSFDVRYSGTAVTLSNYQVPEPDTLALLLGLGLLFVLRRKR
ncbi:MAG: PEP-CTERM sorting domain-containing protein [Pirellulales bacterium]|nr:PEP-CTERM sorting domain-containing protein [Pirellulales bacterium]